MDTNDIATRQQLNELQRTMNESISRMYDNLLREIVRELSELKRQNASSAAPRTSEPLLYNKSDAAKRLGISRSRILKLIAAGDIIVNDNGLVSSAELMRYAASPRRKVADILSDSPRVPRAVRRIAEAIDSNN